MNHDYAHCLDYSDKCPTECFRGMLVRDLHKQDIKIASWTHFIDTNECMLKRKEKEMIELHEYYYKSGTYFTRPIFVNVVEISCFYEDETNRYITATCVEMKNKMKHYVRETYNTIKEMIENQYKE